MRDDIRARIASHIRDHGQYIHSVAPSAADPSDALWFVYTIGNHGVGLPELLLIGDTDEVFRSILNILGEIQRDRGYEFQHGELVDFTARLPARIVDAGQRGRDEFAVQVGVFYNTNTFEVRQVLLPDPNGRFPGDPACEPPYSDQLVLSSTH